MATREQGIRRTTTVTIGLAAASIAGAVAVGAAAAAGTTLKATTPTPEGSPAVSPQPGTSPAPDPMKPPTVDLGSDGDGPPIIITVGS
jgi:hypothetical protein